MTLKKIRNKNPTKIQFWKNKIDCFFHIWWSHPNFQVDILGFTHLNFPAFFRRRNQRVDRKWWAHAGQQQREEDAKTPNHLFFASNSTIGASISTHTISRITGTSRTGFHSRINPNTGRLTATTHTSTSISQPFSNSVVPLRNNMVRGFSKISSSHLQPFAVDPYALPKYITHSSKAKYCRLTPSPAPAL